MKIIKTEEDLKAIRTCDIKLEKINWVEGGRDMEFTFITSNGGKCFFICTWASEVITALKTNPNEGGYPLTWDITFKQTEKQQWHIAFDFASVGMISLKCNDLKYKDKI